MPIRFFGNMRFGQNDPLGLYKASTGNHVVKPAATPAKPSLPESGPIPQSGTSPRTSRIRSIVEAAAIRHGEDPATALRIVELESRFNPNAKNPNSTAGGLAQFIDDAAKEMGVKDRYDPYEASDGLARLMKRNRETLKRKLGRNPTPGEIYLAHQQGAGGARQLLGNPSARAVDIVGADAVKLNGGSPDMTAQQFADLWVKKAESGMEIRGGEGTDRFQAPGEEAPPSRRAPRSGPENLFEFEMPEPMRGLPEMAPPPRNPNELPPIDVASIEDERDPVYERARRLGLSGY